MVAFAYRFSRRFYLDTFLTAYSSPQPSSARDLPVSFGGLKNLGFGAVSFGVMDIGQGYGSADVISNYVKRQGQPDNAYKQLHNQKQ